LEFVFSFKQLIFFIKSPKSKHTDYSGESPVTTIPMPEGEATCCMGLVWTTCVDKTTNRISLKTLIAWYLVGITVDIVITVLFYFILTHFYRIEV